MMESKGGKKKSSSNYPQYETPLGYKIEDVRPHGGIDIFRSAAYSNVSKDILIVCYVILVAVINAFERRSCCLIQVGNG